MEDEARPLAREHFVHQRGVLDVADHRRHRQLRELVGERRLDLGERRLGDVEQHQPRGTEARDLARELGISLGKANYCLQSLMEKGLVKANNFKNSNNKKAYIYYLTRKGIAEKARATTRFLNRKMAEYEALQREIETLKHELTGR